MTSALLHSHLTNQIDTRSGLETIFISSKLLLSLVNNIIDFSKLENGKMGLEEVPTDIAKVVRETVDSVRSMALERKVQLLIEMDEAISKNVLCDSLKLRQILTNLLGNAIKFTKDKSMIKICINEDLSRQSPNPHPQFAKNLQVIGLKFSVVDEGPGISPDKISALFERFVQLEQSQETKVRYGGSGLGLHISQKFVHLMQGQLWVEKSVVGQGTTFSFWIPVCVLPPSSE